MRKTRDTARSLRDCEAAEGWCSVSSPMRELFSADQLGQSARELARRQRSEPEGAPQVRRLRGLGVLLAKLTDSERVLRDVRRTLLRATGRGLDISPAGAWLLDNFFIVVEHAREIRASMPRRYYDTLPKLSTGTLSGYPRVYEIALELIAHTDGQLDQQNIEIMMREYQSVEPLTLGELWAWPVMLRMGLLENVRRMAMRTALDLTDVACADEWVGRFREAAGDEIPAADHGEIPSNVRRPTSKAAVANARLARELATFVAYPPELTPAFLTRFFQQIRAARADFTPLLWLEQWIAEDAMSVEEAVQRSMQRLALTQLVMANSITSLRTVASFPWPEFVESMSATEAVLRTDPTAVYQSMTFDTRDRYRHAVERMARRAAMPEPTVAAAAIGLASRPVPTGRSADDPSAIDDQGLTGHVGYYLLGSGCRELERAIGFRPTLAERIQRFVGHRPGFFYFGSLALMTIGFLAIVLTPLPDTTAFGARALVAMLALLPVSEVAIALVNQLAMMLVLPARLSRLDHAKNGVPVEHRTMVVVPMLLDRPGASRDALDHLETQFLSNHDPEIRFALLGDFTDADSETRDTDAAIVQAAVEGVRRLNREYGEDASPFYYLHRPRRWNPNERVWMGWERKRGKLAEFNAFVLARTRGAFSTVEGDISWLAGVRFAITLDADTVLPRDAAAALVGTIAHPLNRAVVDTARGRVVRGYGILQPRVTVTLESANRSRFASIFAGHPGVDPYTSSVSDVYQDLFGEGTYTGKGIYDIAVVERLTGSRFPENTVLSHDLIEGAYARAGLVTDVEIFDEYPSRYLTATSRQHRWIRGDWQLLPLLLARGPVRMALTNLSRWKIVDNLRRSLLPIAMLAWLVAGWTVLPGRPAIWTAVALAIFATQWLAAPALATMRPPPGQSWRPYYAALERDVAAALAQVGLAVVFLPHQAIIATDAIVRALVRTYGTHRHMLEWQTASQAEQASAIVNVRHEMAFAVLLGVVLASWGTVVSHMALALPFAACWLAAPWIARRISAPLLRGNLALSMSERATLLRYAKLHWRYFDCFVRAETHWLVPDNYQETPNPVVADRTSPTNIGLQLLATVSAFDLGFIERAELITRLTRALDTMESMRRLRGHFYNWYRLSDLAVLEPPYVSTVDSGNLAGHLIAVASACRELADNVRGAHGEAEAIDFGRLGSLAERARAIALGMDFTMLLDERRALFAIGFSERANRLDPSSYDLLASEARLASFVAIAKGDARTEHWFRLGRALTSHAGRTALVSWSGSMFEYLMPVLVLPSQPYSLLDQTHRAAVRRQIVYARARGVPWGISESAYNGRDQHHTYQYRAFGVPDLALQRRLANELVIAPYASALAVLTDPHDALRNLESLERAGALGDFGFYDAIDYSRPDPHSTRAIVRTSMAHHIGMSLAAFGNALDVIGGEGVWQRRFMADPYSRAARLLLDERVPRRYVAQSSQPDVAEPEPPHGTRPAPVVREFDSAATAEPRVSLLGGVPYCALITNAGSGYSRSHGMAVMRWRADATRDDTGHWIYVKDISARRLWSVTYQPTAAEPDAYRVRFATDRAVFVRRDGDIGTRTDIVVVQRDRAEVRVVTLTNRSRSTRDIELTSYGEVVLTDPDADRAHPAFQKLFVETEWLPGGMILASRRPRTASEHRPWCAHVVATGPERVGDVGFETDRAQFLGRGRTSRNPRALDDTATLTRSVGAVLDPIVALGVRLRLKPGRSATVAFTTLVADSRDEARQVADRYLDLRAADRALSLSSTTAQVELRDLDVSPSDAALYQELAGALIYPNEELRASVTVRAENRRGQRALWMHGISGDWPLVLGTIGNAVGLPSVRELLVAHKYWRMKGVRADLVILNAEAHSYVQHLHDQLMSIVRTSSEGGLIDRPGGVFVRRADGMTDEDVALLRATARITIVCDGVGLGKVHDAASGTTLIASEDPWATATRPRRQSPPLPILPAIASATIAANARAIQDGGPHQAIDLANGLGRLTDEGDYEIRVAGASVPPAPWANVIANPNAGFCVTERGGGFAWVENSYFFRLTPWYNDPVCDPCGEVIYLRDEEFARIWTPTPGPAPAVDGPAPAYTVRHAPGRTTFTHECHDIASELVLGVPELDPVKVSRLTLTNRGPVVRLLTLTTFVEWALGAQREHTRHQLHTWRDEATGAVFAENFFADDFTSRVAFSWVSEPVSSFTANREEFIGRNGDLVAPAALSADALSGTTGPGYDPCAALRCHLTLHPGETREVTVLLGAASSEDEARAIISRLATPAAATAALDAAVRGWDNRLSTIRVRTPSPEFDAIVNRWSLYQALSCRMWARSALYQSSGAYGFRDQLQDCMAFLYAEPGIARAHIMRCAGRQFQEGDVQHWWHEPSGRGVRTRFSDDLVWLPFVADQYVCVTGDRDVWDERAPFLEQRPLAPGEQESYEEPHATDETATLYEHCVRALDRACTIGPHGLPLIGCGDWNDGMNRVGTEGKGESVWLAWFLIATLRRFAGHADARHDGDVATRCRQRANAYSDAVERTSWDGAWYRRAYFDDGTPLGSVENTECRIDSIAQSWSVLSAAGDPARARRAMQSVSEHLVREDARLIMLLTPPFDRSSHDPGYIKGYVPGVRENGAQYTHAALWTALATAMLGDGDRAYHLFEMLNPLTHARTDDDVAKYKVEPYVVCADVYTATSHLGQGGWTWYTGSASWMYRVALEGILGFTKRGDRLSIEPCVPTAWREFTIDYRYGSSVYTIVVRNPAGVSSGVAHVEVDGRATNERAIELSDNGEPHYVVITMADSEN